VKRITDEATKRPVTRRTYSQRGARGVRGARGAVFRDIGN